MNLKNIVAVAGAVGALSVLAGCSNGPDDSLAVARIEQYYKDREGTVVSRNIKRINGWKQGDDSYTVEYAYDVVADCDYVDCVFKLIAQLEKRPEQYSSKGLEGIGSGMVYAAVLAGNGSERGMSSLLRAELLQQENGKLLLDVGDRIGNKRLDDKLLKYIGDYSVNGSFVKQKIMLHAIVGVEVDGVEAGVKRGAKLDEMTLKLPFRKTEKGWQLVE